jgi:enolase
MSLADYIKLHHLDTVLSDTLNQCIKARAENPLRYMADSLLNKTTFDILHCKAYYVFDSRGVPTTEVAITTAKGVYRATCPSGSFQTLSEFVERRDDDPGKYNGRGVMRAVHEINEKISPLIVGKCATDQEQIDHILLENTSLVNVMYPVSVAVYKAGHDNTNGRYNAPLPILKVCETPGFQQQLCVVPVNKFNDHEEAVRMCVEVYHACPRICDTLVHGLSVLTKAISTVRHAGKVRIVVDMNASEFLTEDNYYEFDKTAKLNRDEMHAMYKRWTSEYPIEWIENPFDHEEAFEPRDYYLSSHPIHATQLFCLKPSQYGTVTRIKEVCKSFGSIIVSNRTGDTDDTFEYTLALELGAKYIRLGNVQRLNCLMRDLNLSN